MTAEGNSESVSENRRRGRPRSDARFYCDRLRQLKMLPDGCARTQTNFTYRTRALHPVSKILSADDQRTLFGCTADDIRRGAGRFPKGWDTAAEEIGRFLFSIDADEDAEADYLRVAVNARRDGVSWRAIRSHFRSLRLGEREGNALSLLSELARTIDAYRSRFPATTDQMIVGAVRSLLEVVSEETDPESGSPTENDRTACDP
jgi:hypothetical protein